MMMHLPSIEVSPTILSHLELKPERELLLFHQLIPVRSWEGAVLEQFIKRTKHIY